MAVIVTAVVAFAQAPSFRLPAAASQSPAPANQTPQQVPPSVDPASSQFTAESGMLLVTIKPTAIADYEDVIRTLQGALAADTDPQRAAAAKSWRVFKATEVDAKGNFVFIHVLMPAVKNFDYRPSLLLDELVKDLAPGLLTKYQEAFAAPPTKLNLTEFARMSVAPVAPKKPQD